jgi:Mn-dependent DtxR family transcriptional regulator
MVRPSDVQEVLQRSPVPLGAGAIAETLGSHWGTVAELLIALERQGSIVRQGHGWVVAQPATRPPAFDSPAGFVQVPGFPNPTA